MRASTRLEQLQTAAEQAIAAAHPQTAIKPLLEIVRSFPEQHGALLQLGQVLFDVGHYAQAAGCFEQRLARLPHDGAARIGLAMVWERQGEYDRALELVAPLATAQGTTNAITVWATLKRRVGSAEAALPVLRAALEKQRPPFEQVLLHYVTAECCDQLARYEEAFEHYVNANTLRGEQYEAAAHRDEIDRLIELTVPSPFDTASCLPRPILIVGFMRTGSTLVEQVLSQHPQVVACGEHAALRTVANVIRDRYGPSGEWYDYVDRVDNRFAGELSRWYLEEMQRVGGAGPAFTDKTLTNYLLLPLAARLLPGVKVIHCQRDPFDTCLSCYFKNFKARHPFTTRLDWLGQHYRQYERLMAHFAEKQPIQPYPVHYEELVSNPRPVIQGLLEFAELPWHEGCLAPEQNRRIARTASYEQVKRPIYQGAVGRAARYRRWLNPLVTSLDRSPSWG